MERKELAEQVIDFSIKNQLFKDAENMQTEVVANQLEESWFLEFLIQIFILAKDKEGIDFEKLEELIKELEKVRFELVDGEQ